MSTSDPYASGHTPSPGGESVPGQQPAPQPYPADPSQPAYGAPIGQPYPTYPPAPQGYPQAPGYPAAPGYGGYPAPAKTNTMAIVSLVLSIAGIVIIPFIASLVGAILGHVSLGQLKTSGEQGRGMALTGVILGWVGVGLWAIGLILFFASIAWFTSVGGVYST